MKINHLLKDCQKKSYIYNLNFILSDAELDSMRGIKYVCMQGSVVRAKELARKLSGIFLNVDMNYFEPINLIKNSRYEAYRVGNILSISHGMGNTSILTLLHSITKVMYYAGNLDVEYIRIGTSGGIGVEAGTVILTNTAYMPNLVPGHKVSALGKDIIYPTDMNNDLNERILQSQPNNLGFKVLLGNSIAADDFYLGQARFDGAIRPKYDAKVRAEYLDKIKRLNILNFEMESTALASFCRRAEIPATMIAVTLLNRMYGDQITVGNEALAEYSNRTQDVAINYLKSQL